MLKNKCLLSAFSLFIALLASSCVLTDKSLGNQFLSDDFKLEIDTISFNVPISITALDSIQGYSFNSLIFGNMNTEDFGMVSSSGATMICPYSDSTFLGVNPKLRSVYLHLNIDSTIVYDESQKGIAQNVYVYRMLNSLNEKDSYNTSITAADYDPVPISIGSPVFFGDDSLRIALTPEFGEELLATTPAEFSDPSLFVKRVKGIYITTDSPEEVKKGGRLNYLGLTRSFIYLNYTLTDPERKIYNRDTTETFMFGYRFAINSVRTSSNHFADEKPTDKLYIESLSGVKPKIKGSELKAMIDKWMGMNGFTDESVLISKATLDFPYESSYRDYKLVDSQYPPMIFPCYKYASADSSQTYIVLKEVATSSSIGKINRTMMKYSCDITDYTQALIKKRADSITAQDDMIICPITMHLDSNNNPTYLFDNESYKRAVLNGPTCERKPKLSIVYTIINDK